MVGCFERAGGCVRCDLVSRKLWWCGEAFQVYGNTPWRFEAKLRASGRQRWKEVLQQYAIH